MDSKAPLYKLCGLRFREALKKKSILPKTQKASSPQFYKRSMKKRRKFPGIFRGGKRLATEKGEQVRFRLHHCQHTVVLFIVVNLSNCSNFPAPFP